MRGGVSRRGFVFAGAALSLTGCATTPGRVAAQPGETWPELEPLLAAATSGDVVTIRMASKGCTDKADIVFWVERWDDHAVVAFARRRLETCRGARGSATLTFSYAELGLAPGKRVVFANPPSPERR